MYRELSHIKQITFTVKNQEECLNRCLQHNSLSFLGRPNNLNIYVNRLLLIKFADDGGNWYDKIKNIIA